MSTGKTGKLGFLPRLESMRGIAAVSVVGYHMTSLFTDTSVTGMAPVVMFFVLSGFVLARSLQNNPNPIAFLRHRLFRLFPAAIAVVALLTLLHRQYGFYVGYEAKFDPLNVLLNAIMVRHDINGVMWSMTVECFATPVILLSVWTFQRFGPQPLMVSIAVLFGLSFWGPYVHLLGGVASLAPLYAFVAGVLLQMQGERTAERLRAAAASVLSIAAIALLCFCGSQKQSALIIALETLSSSLLVLLVAFRSSIGLFAVLDLRPVRFYGRISYSFYLLHPIGMSLAVRLLDARGLPVLLTISVMTIVAVALTTPMAWLSWRYIEKPFVALGRRLATKQPSPASAIEPAPSSARSTSS
ncbi:acyltransferase [Bradyrhizobium neotropicale]|uniref:acyltransferase family protein n=1 Tax=Bradyrhizobium neotropicale TaxID=1497615 RepID=UPI001AD72E56|nr:acyltransferase [Bradyrhizobium neotropicale]MBO4224768.1 acyltransferase family protein [Bradyrhizobium neotropicale]